MTKIDARDRANQVASVGDDRRVRFYTEPKQYLPPPCPIEAHYAPKMEREPAEPVLVERPREWTDPMPPLPLARKARAEEWAAQAEAQHASDMARRMDWLTPVQRAVVERSAARGRVGVCGYPQLIHDPHWGRW